MKKSSFILVVIALFALLNISCSDEGKVRKYTEKNVKTKTEKIMKPVSMHSGTVQKKSLYEWDIPEGWVTGRSTSRMRLATFITKDDKEEAECTIIPLLGNGGGLEPNVQLWLQQIGINLKLTSSEFKEFIDKSEKFKTKSGLDVIKIDTSDLVRNDSDISLMVSMIKVNNFTVFIKFKGQKTLLVKNKDKFINLSKSFRVKK